MDTIPFNTYPEMEKARPTWEDMIIAYSTIPGYASMRDHDKGITILIVVGYSVH